MISALEVRCCTIGHFFDYLLLVPWSWNLESTYELLHCLIQIQARTRMDIYAYEARQLQKHLDLNLPY